MTDWKYIESLLVPKADGIKNSAILTDRLGAIEISYYYCDAIMDLVDFIREKTDAKELGATHHVMKIIFKEIRYPTGAILEFPRGRNRFDIWLKSTEQSVSVKMIREMNIESLYQKSIGVIESTTDFSDFLWIFYFYRFQDPQRKENSCKYLLAFVDIDILEQESESLRGDLIKVVERSLNQVADHLKIRPTLIIPLENLVKVVDLERIVEERGDELEEKDGIIEKQAGFLKEKDGIIEEKDGIIEDQEKTIQKLQKKLQASK